MRLTVAEVAAEERVAAAPEFPMLPVALAAGAASALIGWLLVSGLVMIGWFTAMAMPVSTALGFAGQFWLAGHGVGAAIGNLMVTLTPLGLTALFVLLVRVVTGLVLRTTSADSLDGRGALRAWGLATAGYTLVTVALAVASGAGSRVGSAVAGGLAVGALGAGWALARRLRALVSPPPALTGIGRAMLAGLAAMGAIAAVVLVVALLRGAARISAIEASLAPDTVGYWLLVALQLLYLPNLLAWTASWALGAGVSVGAGSVVSPMLTTAGLLPAIPVFGAVPEPGPGGPWSYAWVLSGVLVGVTAGWVAVRTAPAGQRSLVSWLARGMGSGLGVALAVLVLAALSRGDLGAARLIAMGPVVPNLLWLAPVPMLVGGAGAALLHWYARGRRLPSSGPADIDSAEASTGSLEIGTVAIGRD